MPTMVDIASDAASLIKFINNGGSMKIDSVKLLAWSFIILMAYLLWSAIVDILRGF